MKRVSPRKLLPSPAEIIAELDRYVVGQVEAKRALAAAVYNHYISLALADASRGKAPTSPQHLLLVGPTGSGKSYMVKKLAEYLGVPFVYASCTSLVQAGYVGGHIEEVVRLLLKRAGNDVFRAERGIIFLDEFDKIRRTECATGPDVSGEGVQTSLLTILDGRLVSTADERSPGKQDADEMDSSRILFVCGGAFVGLEEIVRQRTGGVRLGFGACGGAEKRAGGFLRGLRPCDLVEFGFIPELVGRFASWAVLQPFRSEDLVRILKESDDSVLRSKLALWEAHGIRLRFTDGALKAVAEEGLRLETGARALSWMVEQALDDVDWRPVELAEAGVREIVVDAQVVRRRAAPRLVRAEKPDAANLARLEELRRRAFHPPVTNDEGGLKPKRAPGFTDTTRMRPGEIQAKLEEIKERLAMEKAHLSARLWWQALEKANAGQPDRLLRLAEEVVNRGATLADCFHAFVKSESDDWQAILHYLDYLLRKRQVERGKARGPGKGRPGDRGEAKKRGPDQEGRGPTLFDLGRG